MSVNGVAIIVAILGSVAMIWLGWYTCRTEKRMYELWKDEEGE